jgi:hypothetical protein
MELGPWAIAAFILEYDKFFYFCPLHKEFNPYCCPCIGLDRETAEAVVSELYSSRPQGQAFFAFPLPVTMKTEWLDVE